MLSLDSSIGSVFSSIVPERFSNILRDDVFNPNQIKALFETEIQFFIIFSGRPFNLRLNLNQVWNTFGFIFSKGKDTRKGLGLQFIIGKNKVESHDERPAKKREDQRNSKLYRNAGINGQFPTAQVSQLTFFFCDPRQEHTPYPVIKYDINHLSGTI